MSEGGYVAVSSTRQGVPAVDTLAEYLALPERESAVCGACGSPGLGHGDLWMCLRCESRWRWPDFAMGLD